MIPISLLGGQQGDTGSLFGVSYAAGSLRDYVVEAFAGRHDYLNSGYWYLENGNARNLTGFAAGFGEVLNAANVIVATPFVAASVIPQSVLLVH
jgi:filamentous hemagglutinin